MATNKKLSPETIDALSLIDQTFWAEALRIVEQRLAAEDAQRKLKPVQRVRLLRPVNMPPGMERRCSAMSCHESR